MDVQEIRKLDAYLKRLFGNPRIRVVPKKSDSADVFVGEEAIGSLVLDEDEEDDERSYNFEVKITLGDATTTAPDLKKLDAYLKRKFDNSALLGVTRATAAGARPGGRWCRRPCANRPASRAGSAPRHRRRRSVAHGGRCRV